MLLQERWVGNAIQHWPGGRHYYQLRLVLEQSPAPTLLLLYRRQAARACPAAERERLLNVFYCGDLRGRLGLSIVQSALSSATKGHIEPG